MTIRISGSETIAKWLESALYVAPQLNGGAGTELELPEEGWQDYTNPRKRAMLAHLMVDYEVPADAPTINVPENGNCAPKNALLSS